MRLLKYAVISGKRLLRCQHILKTGLQCKHPALIGMRCYVHIYDIVEKEGEETCI